MKHRKRIENINVVNHSNGIIVAAVVDDDDNNVIFLFKTEHAKYKLNVT